MIELYEPIDPKDMPRNEVERVVVDNVVDFILFIIGPLITAGAFVWYMFKGES